MTDSTDALIADATPDPQGYPFDFGGRTWRLKPQFDLRVQVRLKREDLAGALKLMLGAEQAEELIDLETDDVFDDTVLVAMIELVAKKQGVTAGESQASSS